jgi:methionine-rich copper-binding protein CopC
MSRRIAALLQPLRRVLTVAALAVAVSTVLLGLGVPAASAHDQLLGATPADGSSVATAPDRVDLTFSGTVQELGAQVLVTGPAGAAVTQGAVQVSGTSVSQLLAPDLPTGSYAVTWRVTSADGHPVAGTTSFTVTAGATASGDVREAPAAQPAGSSSSTLWIGLGAGAVLLVAVAIGVRELRRRA